MTVAAMLSGRRGRAALPLLTRELADRRRTVLGWAGAGVLFVATYALVWPTFRDNSAQYRELIDSMGPAYRAFLTVGSADIGSPAGYLGVEFLSLLGPIIFIGAGIALGAAGLAGDEDRGTLELPAARPVSRRRLYAERAGAVLLGVLTVGALLLAVQLVASAAAGMDLPPLRLAAAYTALVLLGWLFGAIAFAAGAATGRPGASRLAAAGLAVVAYLANAVADLAPRMHGLRPWSPFHWTLGSDPLVHGLDVVGVLQLLACVGVALVVGCAVFVRRDLRL